MLLKNPYNKPLIKLLRKEENERENESIGSLSK
jgi:hypothetical protein